MTDINRNFKKKRKLMRLQNQKLIVKMSNFDKLPVIPVKTEKNTVIDNTAKIDPNLSRELERLQQENGELRDEIAEDQRIFANFRAELSKLRYGK